MDRESPLGIRQHLIGGRCVPVKARLRPEKQLEEAGRERFLRRDGKECWSSSLWPRSSSKRVRPWQASRSSFC